MRTAVVRTCWFLSYALASSAVFGAQAASAPAARLSVEPAHPWTPPFGLDRVGRPLEACVELPGGSRAEDEYLLAGLRDGKEVGRQVLKFDRNGRFARASLADWPAEVVLWVKSAGQPAAEVARAVVKPPALEAEAVARPESVINPVDLGTIFVPHGWLLLAPSQKATLEVAALNRPADVSTASATAWYESAPQDKATIALPLRAGQVTRAALTVGAGSQSATKDALHVAIVDAAGKELWRKTIRVMRVTDPPQWPKFGAVATKLRYDAPIPASYPPHKISYDEGWDPKLDDVAVFLPNGARFVFWRGSSYCPFWAGRSNTGFCYEWAEILSGKHMVGKRDCAEPLQDKELRYGRVTIVESTPARVHVRWNYQSCDLDYKVWGDFAVEDFYFYPDGFGTRVMTLTAMPEIKVETNEFIIFTPQSGYPLDYLPDLPLDLLWPDGKAQFRFPCLKGEQQDQWAKLKTVGRDVPLMHRVRFGRHEPLAAICYSPRGSTHDLPGFPPFTDRGALATPMYWGCHWPLSRGYPTGWAISDRIHEAPGHNSMIHAGTPKALRSRTAEMRDAQGRMKTMKQDTWAWLIGMTDADDDRLRLWAQSYASPPTLEVTAGARLDAERYAPERRALRLVVEKPSVTITIKPAPRCINPVLELTGAPKTLARVSLDGKPLAADRYAWDGKTLWLDVTLSQPAELKLEFVEAVSM